MSISLGLSPVGIDAQRAYQQIKQRGEPAPLSAEAQAHLDARQALSENLQSKTVSTEEQIQEQKALEKSCGLMSAILGTQVDVYV